MKRANKAKLEGKRFKINLLSHVSMFKLLMEFFRYLPLPYRRIEVILEVNIVYDGGYTFFEVILRSKFRTLRYLCYVRAFTTREIYSSDIPGVMWKYAKTHRLLIFTAACGRDLLKRNVRIRPLHVVFKPGGDGPYATRISGQVRQTWDIAEAGREIADQVKALLLTSIAELQRAASVFFPSMRDHPPTYETPRQGEGWIPDTGPGPPRLLSSFLKP